MAKDPAQPVAPKVEVVVPVPQKTKITVSDLKGLSAKELEDVLSKAKKSKVGFVILNAPFKVRPVEPIS
jgi:hypothetical protein